MRARGAWMLALVLALAAATLVAGCGEKDEPHPRSGVLSERAQSRWVSAGHGLRLRVFARGGRRSLHVRGGHRELDQVTLTDTARSFRKRFTVANGAHSLRAAVPPEQSPCGGDLVARIRLGGTDRVVTARVPATSGLTASPPRPRWPQPKLDHPEHVRLTAEDREPRLDPAKDYVVHLPREPLRVPDGVVITGGHDVVLEGGEIDVQRRRDGGVGRALLLQKQTGTVHVEGVLIRGAGLGDAINLDERRGATVQLQNLRVEYTHAKDQRHFRDTHPDVVQTWAGPPRLRIDRLSACTGYQGLFLHPTQFDESQRLRLELSRVNITGTLESAYLLWQATRFPVSLRDVWIRPNPRKGNALWPKPEAWKGVHLGTPPRGDFMPPGAAGVNYRR